MSDDTTHWDNCATEGGPAHYECATNTIRHMLEERRSLLANMQRLAQERDAALADAQRFVWWVDDGYNKGPFVVEYLRGIRERWSLDQWRAAIDKAMGGDSPK